LIAHTPRVFISKYRITLILSLYINWYLYSTINKLNLLVYPRNQMKYLKFYNLQTCNFFVYTNATGSCFCFYFTNVKNFDKAEGTMNCGNKLALHQYKVEILLNPWWVIIRCAAVCCFITKYIIAVYFCTRLTFVCFMELLLSEFLLLLFVLALMLVCFISDLDFVPSALSKFFTFVK
jgi:hypothetical protein